MLGGDKTSQVKILPLQKNTGKHVNGDINDSKNKKNYSYQEDLVEDLKNPKEAAA